MLTKVLYIDLSRYRYSVEDRRDLFEEWIGGTGVAVQLLKENMNPEIDPFDEESTIVFAVGPLNAAYPLASKTVAMFKSPLTLNIGESHAGGRTATSIANAGYGAIVITGKSKKPVYIVVNNDKVYFRDARVIWGIEDSLIVARIIAENEKGRGTRSVMRIGGAGERLVRYACVTTETYRHFGRLGLGAVLGSKNVKALVVNGRGSRKIVDRKAYREVYDEIFNLATESDAMKKYHLLGTAVNVKPLNEKKGLPVTNLKFTSSEYAEELSGESFAEIIGRRIACSHCPVACIHIAALRLPYENEPYFYKTLMLSYDYELIYALGTMLGMKRKEDFLKLLYRVEAYGLDAMTTGVCLAWATEALEKGLISEKDTIVKLEFGNSEAYCEAVKYLIHQPNEFYRILAQGVERASEVYGGKEFALAFGKNEMPGYHTGYAAHIGYLIGLRHSHLDNAGYSADQKMDSYPEPEQLVEKLMKEEQWRQVLSSLVVCFFARGVYKPDIVCRALRPVGMEIEEDELVERGKKIYFEKLRLKKAMGFNARELRVPERIFETETPHGKLNKDYIERAIEYFAGIVENC
ncbi:MAG: aldehyde:ferredoxin oxidoreductase [Archaeoglobus sp.]|nr:MAG: aldehyde:ferredoxin oxidoreductase [Archaeoglobus sp.]